ncbi:MAG: PolC-type DNA polymerase III [Lachnospiraceae bacterium]|nr:PolC-type DNA polymerase III [Lachnospiraceae bacterium]
MDVKNEKERKFFDAFTTLKLNEELSSLFEDTVIEHIVHNKSKNRLKIYLASGHILTKPQIIKVEKEIKRQLFSNSETEVFIFERFELSDRYDLSSIFSEYRDGLFEELKSNNRFVYAALKACGISVSEDNHIVISADRNFIQDFIEKQISGFLEDVFLERFNINVTVDYEYKDLPKRKGYISREERERAERILIKQTLSGMNGENGHEGQTADKPESAGDPDEVIKPGSGDLLTNPVPVTEAGGEKKKKAETSGKNTSKSYVSQKSVKFQRRSRTSNNPDVIYGKEINEPCISISDTEDYSGRVTIRGEVIRLEKRITKTEKLMVMFDITDYTDTISCRMFPSEDEEEKLFSYLQPGAFITLCGESDLDNRTGEYCIRRVYGIMKAHMDGKGNERFDDALDKRVELHCHTKMSDMDGVSDVKDIIWRAADWGHKALAITDHGVVQAFTDAYHIMGDVSKKYPDFKLIYGMEGYLVDDTAEICTEPKDHTVNDCFVVFDIETTGRSAAADEIIEIGAVKIEDGSVTDRFSEFVNPKRPIPYRITQLTRITDEMVEDADFITGVLTRFLEFAKGSVLVAHNASFDTGFIREQCKRIGAFFDFSYVDTVGLSRLLLPKLSKYKLDHVAKALNVKLENHHRAVEDAEATAEIFLKLLPMLKEKGITTLEQIDEAAKLSPEMIKKEHAYHVIILAKNEIGRINLYRLVSLSHLKYFSKVQRIPKSLINKYREGLIIGSACEAGELYRAILEGKSEDEIDRIVRFYDYLEIQPLGNNAFMIDSPKHEEIHSYRDIEEINKRIVELGDLHNKLVVGTCDVHFLDPEDEIYRRIIMKGKGFKDADEQAPLFFRTTEEMLKEFYYLEPERAYEIVVENTNKIADMIDRIEPVRPDKCAPVIENSDEILRNICHNRAHEIYGEKLPEIVETRLEKELNSIITNGYAVMYIIAQKLVWKSVEDGYLVGSRGSVGSSFVAAMAGITEVNPLPPHYLCNSCHYVDFDSEEVRAYAGRAGCDMPDKACPVCGKPLSKEGFDIPFETFLGFKGNKEPDIDLNFSGEYQSKAHKYTEVIFGDGQTFKAGTIETVQDKTAYGYVRKYYEEKNIHKRGCEIDRIARGCTGIHSTTGQHPGGIIVLPLGEEIDTFTPVQRPANKDVDIVTTHFDYHSIDHNLLKLDILGHDDPTMIRMLQDLTDTDPTTVPLDDRIVMSLFQNTSALKITPEDIGGCALGTLGIPEFGTDFAMQMLIDTKPAAFSDLVRIAGLAHGTDVWLGNAEKLIKEGTATISTAICTRDDIMVYLINKGLESSLAFNIMEKVRKGKGLTPEWEEAMTQAGVPDWYIWSCNKIKYMFPKAHAAAYVMMAWRIAYYKANYPLAYYAAFFSIRAKAFNYEKMCFGRAKVEQYIREYKSREDELSPKEQNELKDMRLVQEMYARGFEFLPIDLKVAKAHRFQVIDGKIMPSFDSIDGLGDKASDAVYNACLDGGFLSKQDFQERTGVNQTVLETMSRLEILKGLSDTNQLSLFDMLKSS